MDCLCKIDSIEDGTHPYTGSLSLQNLAQCRATNYFPSILLSKEKAPETTIKLQLLAFTRWGTPPLNGSCDQLGILSKPTLIIVGTKDMAIAPANSLIIAAKIPGSRLVQIRGGGHGLMYQYPEQFSNILNTFLEIA